MVAAVDPLEERRRHVERAFGVPATFSWIDELVAGADVDAVAVCTPTNIRREAVEQLASAGKHLLVEKPMADELSDARAVVDLASRGPLQE